MLKPTTTQKFTSTKIYELLVELDADKKKAEITNKL